MEYFICIGFSVLVLGLLVALFRSRGRLPVIASPTLGIFDLSEGEAGAEIGADKAALQSIFSGMLESSTTPPVCHVLFIYCHLETDGSIRHSPSSLREVIRDSGAVVVVMASENTGPAYITASKNKPGYGFANLVMTLSRHGDAFPRFFERLFTEMKKGQSMPVAWVKLAPQVPGMDHTDCPECIFACEAGQVAFR